MVDVTSLDAFTADYGIPHLLFVKMDVQGAEPQALAGMARLLERGAVDFIMFEYVK
jgi:FkbM family methyltransferase